MGHRIPRLILFLKIVVVSLLSLTLFGCEEKIKPSVASSPLGKQVPTQESWDAAITFTDSARVSAIVKAGHIAAFSSDGFTILNQGVQVDFYDEQGHHSSRLTSDSGRVLSQTEDLEAYGHVVVISDSGTTLKTEMLFWSNQNERIHTPAYVEITSPSEQIQGHGLESDQYLRNYRIVRVTGRAVTEE